MKVVLDELNDCFNVNLSLLNLRKMGFINFKTKNAQEINGKLQYGNKFIGNLLDTKFLGFCLNNTIYWRVHTDYLIPKLSSAWCAIATLE
jgi:hypothetical protein